ncbi:hypothetical protein M513_04628, partial [Trichuris suis]
HRFAALCLCLLSTPCSRRRAAVWIPLELIVSPLLYCDRRDPSVNIRSNTSLTKLSMINIAMLLNVCVRVNFLQHPVDVALESLLSSLTPLLIITLRCGLTVPAFFTPSPPALADDGKPASENDRDASDEGIYGATGRPSDLALTNQGWKRELVTVARLPRIVYLSGGHSVTSQIPMVVLPLTVRHEVARGKSRSGKAGVQFTTCRIHRPVWVNYAERIGAGAAVLEYLTAEVFWSWPETQLTTLVIRADEELSRFLRGVTITLEFTACMLSCLARHYKSEGRYETGSGAKGKTRSQSSRAGLKFPVCRIHCPVWVNYAERIGAGAPVYVAAVVEYLTAEVLELARNTAHDSKNTYVIPCQLQLVIRANEELSKFLGGVTIAQGGVLANIQGTFLLKKSKMKASKKD